MNTMNLFRMLRRSTALYGSLLLSRPVKTLVLLFVVMTTYGLLQSMSRDLHEDNIHQNANVHKSPRPPKHQGWQNNSVKAVQSQVSDDLPPGFLEQLNNPSVSNETVANSGRQKRDDQEQQQDPQPLPPRGYVNLLELPKIKFLRNYANPCWTGDVPGSDDSDYSEEISHKWEDSMEMPLHCLPYFYQPGFPKTGTTDVYQQLMKHPLIIHMKKSPHWWSWKRIGYQLKSLVYESYGAVVPFHKYVTDWEHQMKFPSEEITFGTLDNSRDFHPVIFGDSSPSTMWSNFRWHTLPENKGRPLEEGPQYHVAHYIAHFTPKARFIITLRNPTHREYSWYMYNMAKNSTLSAVDFHVKVVASLAAMKACLKQRSAWSCVNDVTVTDVIPHRRVRLQLGMYSVWLTEWFKVFPWQQFHFSTLEDYSINRKAVVNSMFRFLGLDPFEVKGNETEIWRNSSGQKKNRAGEMLPETKALLDEFYKPFNKHLSELLQDDKYLFLDS